MNDEITTVEVLRNTAPRLTKEMTDDNLKQLIADARLQVLASGFPRYIVDDDGDQIKIREVATRVLALHIATMDANPASSGVISEQVDVIHRTYADKTGKTWLSSSSYGQYYLWLLENFADGGRPHFAVLQH